MRNKESESEREGGSGRKGTEEIYKNNDLQRIEKLKHTKICLLPRICLQCYLLLIHPFQAALKNEWKFVVGVRETRIENVANPWNNKLGGLAYLITHTHTEHTTYRQQKQSIFKT